MSLPYKFEDSVSAVALATVGIVVAQTCLVQDMRHMDLGASWEHAHRSC